MKRLFTLLFVLLAVRGVGAAEALHLGVLGVRPEPQMLVEWQPLASYLQTALQRPVELRIYDHAGMDAAVARRAVDIIVTAPGQYVLMQQTTGLSAPLATLVTRGAGYDSSAFGGVIIALAERTDINTLRDVAGKRVAAISEEAFGGFQTQMFELLEAGVPPPAADHITFTQLPHDRVVEEVLSGRADIGFVRCGLIEALTREGRLDPSRLKVINRQNLPAFPEIVSTRLYPDWPVAVAPQIDKRMAGRIAAALLSLPHGNLGGQAVYGFETPANYSGVEMLLRRLRLPPFDRAPEITPADLWRRYAPWIVALSGLVTLLGGASIGLVILYRRSRRAAAAIHHLNAALEDERRVFIGGPTLAFKWRAAEGWPVEYVSPNVRTQWGYEPEALTSGAIPFASLIHPDDLQRVGAEVQGHCNAGAPCFEQEYRIRRADGSYRWVYDFTVVVRDSAAKITHFHGHLSDVTDRRAMEEALRTGEQKLRAIFDQTFQFIGVLSTDGILLQANHAALQFAGTTEESVLGRPFWATPWWRHSAELQERLRIALRDAAGGTLVRLEVTHPDAKGELHYVDFSLKPVTDSAGHVVQLLAEGRDITERKLAEEERRRYREDLEQTVQQRTAELLLARDAAEAANKAKSIFLANMSHELRTPLNAILGFSSIMRNDPVLPESLHQYLDIINRSGEHLLTLINDVLEMAKIEAGRIQLEEAPFDLGGMVRDVTEMMEVRAQEKGLRLLTDQSSEFPRYIVGDEAHLRQVLINLVGNAVKFTQEGGVTVRLGTRANHASHLIIEVEDTGPGISPQDQQRIFQPFTQLGDQRDNKGTGLGLTITRQFVEMMSGTITLESTPGKGSLFRVELPLAAAAESDVTQAQATSPGNIIGLAPGQPEFRILIVEDQMENRLLLKTLMESAGFRVTAVENGVEGVKAFERWNPHLIWMDRKMPVMGGMEATRRIRALPGGKAVKIVAVTASAFQEQRAEMLAAGMDDFVRKPFRFNEIFDCLSRQLGVRFLRETVSGPEPSVSLATARVAALPPELRARLRTALESLDAAAIEEAIGEVGCRDQELERQLTHIAGGFDYQAILDALAACRERA
jgi:PAS domain S-box-containing protein